MAASFSRRPFGSTEMEVFPLGLSGTYRPGRKTFLQVTAEEGIH